MGMFTEFFFRAHIKEDAPITDWLESLTKNEFKNWNPYDKHHPFFQESFGMPVWISTLTPGGAVYQITRPLDFTKGISYNELIVHSSAKNIDDEGFLDWISPYLEHDKGDFLGYTLYEDSWGFSDTEQPKLIFYGDK